MIDITIEIIILTLSHVLRTNNFPLTVFSYTQIINIVIIYIQKI